MDITISYFMLTAIIVLALLGGFWIGRSVRWMMVETENRISREEVEEEKTNGEQQSRKIGRNDKRIPLGWSIGSPVTGAVRSFCSSEGKGVLLQPESGQLYAPASGKITKLFPMGNQIQMRTDFGVELLLRVGETRNDLHSIYYRSYVVQNEIVPKGKLLLEFDMEGLCGEGVDVAVLVTIAGDRGYEDIRLTPRETVKTGEELLWLPPIDCDFCGIRRE